MCVQSPPSKKMSQPKNDDDDGSNHVWPPYRTPAEVIEDLSN